MFEVRPAVGQRIVTREEETNLLGYGTTIGSDVSTIVLAGHPATAALGHSRLPEHERVRASPKPAVMARCRAGRRDTATNHDQRRGRVVLGC